MNQPGISTRQPAAAGSPAWQGAAFGVGSLLLRGYVDLRVDGRGHLPPRGQPFLLVSNHSSHFDPPLLTWAAERWIDWVAMVELYRHRWAARAWNALGVIPVDRSRLDRRAAVQVLRRLALGRTVGLFPERGIRQEERSLFAGGAVDAGACRLAIAAGVPIVPTVILGSDRLYRASGWLLPRRAFSVSVRFGEPIQPPSPQMDAKAAAGVMSRSLVVALCDLKGKN